MEVRAEDPRLGLIFSMEKTQGRICNDLWGPESPEMRVGLPLSPLGLLETQVSLFFSFPSGPLLLSCFIAY